MSHKQAVEERIIEAVPRSEELTLDCTGVTWNRIFMEVVDLSIAGRLILQGIGSGMYIIKLPESRNLAKAEVGRPAP